VIELWLGVVLASLAGSVHCAGMCGGLVLLATADRGGAGAHLAYHGARLLAYATLGAAAATVGALVDLGGLLVGFASAGAWLAGALLIVLLLQQFLPQRGFGRWIGQRMGKLSAVFRGWSARALKLPGQSRAFAIGACSGLLPCGWLYAFAVVAGGTGEPLRGVAIMLAFWIGTLPMLATLGLSGRALFKNLGFHMPSWTPIALLLLSFLMLSGRFGLDPLAMAAELDSAPAEVLPDADEPLPCCDVQPRSARG
jgi:sulfite exporter TauE/SafE